MKSVLQESSKYEIEIFIFLCGAFKEYKSSFYFTRVQLRGMLFEQLKIVSIKTPLCYNYWFNIKRDKNYYKKQNRIDIVFFFLSKGKVNYRYDIVSISYLYTLLLNNLIVVQKNLTFSCIKLHNPLLRCIHKIELFLGIFVSTFFFRCNT